MNDSDRKIIMQNAIKVLASGPPPATNGRMVARAWEKGMGCEALAVNPEDVPARKLVDERKGLRGVEYDHDGIPHFTSKRAYDAYVKSEGCHHRGTHYRKRRKLGKVVIY